MPHLFALHLAISRHAYKVVVNSGCLNDTIVGDLPAVLSVISVPLSVSTAFLLSYIYFDISGFLVY
jgi:hypothetical protein